VRRDDLHPEELLARFGRGSLGPDEAADLRAHVDRCPACALQLELRDDVARAFAPTDVDYEIGARAVARFAESQAQEPRRAAAALSLARERPPRLVRIALVVAILLGSGVAASALVLGTRGRLWGVATPPAETPAPPQTTSRVRAARRPEARDLAAATPLDATKPAPELEPATVSPKAAVPPVRRERPAEAAPTLEATTVEPPAAVVPTTPAPPAPRAPELFVAAERARRQGDAREARRLYGLLAAAFPGSREEIAARVLAGQTLLDELGEPAAALASFERYLRDEPGGPLAEEARVGRAQALGRLGRATEEADAWSELLARHPRSLQAELARRRLAALAGRAE
jgi:TolA-binding protein